MVKNDAESAAYAVERLLRQGLGCESFTGSSGRGVQVQPAVTHKPGTSEES